MRILSKAAAKFIHPADHNLTYDITARDLLALKDVPDWVTETMLYKWMLADGTIEAVSLTATQKELEKDPVQGAHADGKKVIDKDPLEAATDILNADASNDKEDTAKKPARGRKTKYPAYEDGVQ